MKKRRWTALMLPELSRYGEQGGFFCAAKDLCPALTETTAVF